MLNCSGLKLEPYMKLLTVGSHSATPEKKKKTSARAKRSPDKTVVGAKSCSESNPIPARDTRRAQTKPYAHQDPEIPTETEPDLPLSV